MDFRATIERFLADVRHLLQRRTAARTRWLALTALTGVALAAPLAAYAASVDRGQLIGLAAGGLALFLIIAGTYIGRIAPRRRWKANRQVARYVGGRDPAVASDLLSAVELSATESQEGVSRELIDEMIRRTALATEQVKPQEIVPSRPARRARTAFLGAIAVYGAVYLLAPTAIASGWTRMVSSPAPGPFDGAALSDRPLVGDITIRLQFPAHTQRAPLLLPSGSGDLRVMPGTMIELSTTSLGPADSARIVFGEPDQVAAAAARQVSMPGDPPATVEMSIEGRVLSARFSVREPTTYRFLLSAGNRRRTERTGHQIEVEADDAPTVELYTPADELDVTSLKRIELAYIAEDDYGISKVELVLEGKRTHRKTLPLLAPGRRSAQAKYILDLAELDLEPGVRVAYWVEVTDNDEVMGPNVGSSKKFSLRVFSARERHESLIDRQRELLEKMIQLLGGRLVVPAEDLRAHQPLARETATIVVELGGLLAALDKDQLAAKNLKTSLAAMRARLDGHSNAENKLLAFLEKKRAGGTAAKFITAKLVTSDKSNVVELENDVLLLAGWIDRQRLEILLAITDEIEGHQKRLAELFKEFERTGDEELKKEIERELKALEAKLAELATKQSTLPADVSDQFINPDAQRADQIKSCTEEVRELLAKGEATAARKKMQECSAQLGSAAQALEDSLSALRGEKFSEQEKKLGQLMDDLADLTKDQNDIAEATDEVWERYAEKADEMMRDTAKDTRRKLSKTIDKLQKKLESIPADGLTPFAKEELEIVDSRVKDLEEMLADGDMAEALAMAKQAASSLETMDAELESALEDEPRGPFARRTRVSRKAVRKAKPLADKIVSELKAATPSPDQIMDKADRRALDKLRQRQKSVRERARRLAKRTQKDAKKLPGQVGQDVPKRLADASEPMERAGKSMRRRDPSAARQAAREAADKLEQVRKEAQGAARQKQAQGGRGLRDEPVRIPGADEYKAPQKFREDILEAMKKEGAPNGFDELVRRYYQELIR